MPRKDPVTGCDVMTLPEFAKAEGYNSAGEMLDEVFKEMELDCRKWERFLFSNPKEVLKMFKTHYKEYADYFEENFQNDVPKKHVATLFVKSSQGFKTEKHTIVAAFVCKDGKTRIQQLHHTYWGGTRLEPPEEDEWIEIF